MSYLVLDTETTSKYPGEAECLEVAIIDAAGVVLLDTRVRPVHATSWPRAQRIHGIRPADVLRPDVPTLAELTPRIAELLRGQQVVIYNAGYDTVVLAEAFELGPPAKVKEQDLPAPSYLHVSVQYDDYLLYPYSPTPGLFADEPQAKNK